MAAREPSEDSEDEETTEEVEQRERRGRGERQAAVQTRVRHGNRTRRPMTVTRSMGNVCREMCRDRRGRR